MDYISDGSVAPLGSSGLKIPLSMQGGVAIGTDSIYFQAGIMRASFGPFQDDSIVLSPTAPQAGQFSFVIHKDFYTYTSLLMAIAATANDGSGSPLPNKYLALHSLEIHPFTWLDLGLMESVVWGDRFEPLYLLPLPTLLFYSQGLIGFPDNSFFGLTAGLKLPQAVNANFMVYVDDIGFNELIKLDFNTKLKLAGQAEVSWTPHLPFLERLSLGYTLVTPYTYTHIDAGGSTDPNYQNYTNNGQNMGTGLEPDSDRIELTALVRPLSFLDVTTFARFIRHGDGSEGIAGGGDGTYFDSGWVNGQPTFQPGGYPNPPGGIWTRFLTQTLIEKTLQTGLGVKTYFDTVFGRFTASLSYTFEYSWNYNLGASDRLANYLDMELGYRY